MIFCPCCDYEQRDDFPDACPDCGARFDHEAELVGEDWKALVGIVAHGDGCDGAHDSHGKPLEVTHD